MKWPLAFVLVSGFLLVPAPNLFPLSPGLLTPRSSPTQASSTTPIILYAQWVGKNLDVQGRNFAEGATIIVDGQRLKTINFDNALSFELLAKKAKKKVARNQAITLQVQNTNGETSDPFTFYSGFVITMNEVGDLVHLNVGDKFLLYLPPEGDPPALRWTVSIMGATIGSDPTILVQTTEDLPIPHAQGFFQAVRPGQVIVHAEASPLCPPSPRWVCEQSGANFGRFDLGVLVE